MATLDPKARVKHTIKRSSSNNANAKGHWFPLALLALTIPLVLFHWEEVFSTVGTVGEGGSGIDVVVDEGGKIVGDSTSIERIVVKDASYESNLLLFEAVRASDVEAVRSLLEPVIKNDDPVMLYDPNAEDERGITPLIEATLRGSFEVIFILLNHGALAQPAPGFRHTSLRAAALTSNVSLLRTLLEKGANPNAQSEGGRTPLMGACFLRPEYDARPDRGQLSFAAAKFLIDEATVDPTIRNDFNESALDLCRGRGYNRTVTLLEKEVEEWEKKALGKGQQDRKRVRVSARKMKNRH